MAKFKLVKGNLYCSTYIPSMVRMLRKLGWKVEVSELGELL